VGNAFNVKSLHISVKTLVWVTKSVEAENGSATIYYSNLPKGTYYIKVHGEALENSSTILFKIEASMSLTTDSEGRYEYVVDTRSLPPGTLTLTVENTSREIRLLEPSKLSELEYEVIDLKNRVSFLEGEVIKLEGEKVALTEEIAFLEEEVDFLQRRAQPKPQPQWHLIAIAAFLIGAITGFAASRMFKT
jgi:hypothetical protein